VLVRTIEIAGIPPEWSESRRFFLGIPGINDPAEFGRIIVI
jgi:hypothetical protein